MVVCYVDPDSQGWLLEQLPPMIQQQLQKYIHIVGVIFLGVAVSLVLMFALGIEILYFESKQTSARPRRSQGPGTYLLGDSDINNLIGYETGRRYKKVETRGTQYQLEGGGYLCVKCYRLDCECQDNAIQVLPESDAADFQEVRVAEVAASPTAPSLCLRCHDLDCKCKTKQPGLCSTCFEDPCSC